jgi:UDP-N-acetylglucosamine--N-acetylmuramyl-(pentapeptide) pyrophosphoryl-undecaprenol N-acetylglucosamine transferase
MIVAGGTGGHVFPGLAVAERLRQRDVPVVWMGTRRGLEARLVPAAGIPVEWLNVEGLRGHGLGRLLMAPFMIAKALWQAARILRRIRPRLVLGMGGFVSGPGGLMGRCLGIPLVVHEQNARPGLTNRCLARIASRVLAAFPDSFPASCETLVVGNPVRASIVALAEPGVRFAARSGPARLLVVGGSQGAAALNRLVPQALSLLDAGKRPDVWHQAGGRMQESALAAYQDSGLAVRLEPFVEDMAAAYAWADLVVCRAGALTVAELAAAGVASILIPFPHAVDDHQTANGRFLAQGGAAIVVQQADLTAAGLADLLGELLSDRARLLAMAAAARRLARTDADQKVALLCLEQARVREGGEA